MGWNGSLIGKVRKGRNCGSVRSSMKGELIWWEMVQFQTFLERAERNQRLVLKGFVWRSSEDSPMGIYKSMDGGELSEVVGFVGPSPGPRFSSVRTEEAWKARPGVGSLGDAGWGRWRAQATSTWDPDPGPAPGVRHQPAPRSRVLFRPARAAVGALSPPAVTMAPARGL